MNNFIGIVCAVSLMFFFGQITGRYLLVKVQEGDNTEGIIENKDNTNINTSIALELTLIQFTITLNVLHEL